MNNLKKLFVAVVFVFAFASPAFAGGIECGDPTPPASPATAQEAPGGTESLAESGDSLMDAALVLLKGVRALF